MSDSPRFWELFFSVFEVLPRQGPGNRACAERALSLCEGLPEEPDILDLGSGSGAQTMILAELSPGKIIAVDTHEPFVGMIRARVESLGFGDRVEALHADMTRLEFPPDNFDLIWSEGALYNVGIETALRICEPLLRLGGYLVFTDAVWKREGAPEPVRALFADYPTMGTPQDLVALIAGSAFDLVGHFPVPDEAWWDDFYTPLLARIAELRELHTDDESLEILDFIQSEPGLHRDYSSFYGYEFFVCRKNRTSGV